MIKKIINKTISYFIKTDNDRSIHHYNKNHRPNSAEILVPYIMELLNPKSVIDVGCGLGQWLYIFRQNGVSKITGIDGKHVPKDKRYIKDEFIEFDLNNCHEYFSNDKYDLLLSLEVAEHLKKEKAIHFVDLLTRLSNNIIFSAAIPGQTGENHFNEQYPDYWIKLFIEKGYKVLDPFRKRFWNSNISWWYAQNMYLFIKGDIPSCLNEMHWDNNIYIHPKLFKMYVPLS